MLKRKIISTLLICGILLTSIPIGALAEEGTSEPTVSVGGKEMYHDSNTTYYVGADDSAAIINDGSAPSDWRARFEPTSKTLTLNGFTYEGTGTQFDQSADSPKSAGIYISGIDGTLKITLIGANSVIHKVDYTTSGGRKTSNSASYGIYISGALEISGTSGTDTLNVFGCETYGPEPNTGAQRPSYGMYVGGDLTINAAVTFTGGNTTGFTSPSYGLYGNSAITISDNANVDAAGGNTQGAYSTSYGLYGTGAITISGGAIVNAAGKTGAIDDYFSFSSDSYGLYGNNTIEISGTATVTAAGGRAKRSSYGLYGTGAITISDTVTVTATGGEAKDSSYGLYSGNNVDISGGKIIANGGEASTNGSCGIYAQSISFNNYADVEASAGSVNSNDRQKPWSIGIKAEKTVNISGHAKVTAASGPVSYLNNATEMHSFGIQCLNIDIADYAQVTARSGNVTAPSANYNSTRHARSIGIYVTNKNTETFSFKISGSAIVEATGSNIQGTVQDQFTSYSLSHGIFSNVISIYGGTVIAKSGSNTSDGSAEPVSSALSTTPTFYDATRIITVGADSTSAEKTDDPEAATNNKYARVAPNTVTMLDLSELLPYPASGGDRIESFSSDEYSSGIISWDTNTDSPVTSYTAAFTLTAASGFTFEGLPANALTHGSGVVTHPAGTDTTLEVTVEFEEQPAAVNHSALDGKVTAPVKNEAPNATPISDDQYTGTVSWNGSPAMFLGGTSYTATVTLTAKAGYTFTGAGPFTYTGASVAALNNTGSTLTLTIVFPATAACELSSVAVTTQPILVYKYGETFRSDGMVVTATYDDGTTAIVAGYTTDYDSRSITMEDQGETVTVSYAEGGITKTTNTDAITVTKADGPAAPSVTFSFDGPDANRLMGATTLMEYRLDGGSVESGWISCSDNQDLTASLSSINETNDIRVRVKETSTHEAGSALIINITKAAVPTDVAATNADTSGKGTLNGVTSAMEYQKSGETSWITGTGSTLSLDPGTYFVRVKAAGTVLASDSKELTIAAYVKGTPTAADLSFDLSSVTYDGTAKPVTVAIQTAGIGDITVKYNGSTTPPTDAGTYAVTADIAESTMYNAATLPLGNFTINKAAYSGNKTASATVRANAAETNLTVALPSLPDGADYALSGTVGGSAGLIASHSVAGTTLTFSTNSYEVASATIIIPVSGADNYNDYNVVVTITAVDKEIVSISGLTAAANLVYNGMPQPGFVGTVTVSGDKVPTNELVYTYTSTDGGGYNGTTPPINAGTYKLVVSVAEENEDYTGAHTEIVFTIAKATITVTAISKSAYVGDPVPALGENDYTVTGLVSGEMLKTAPTLAYASTPDMTRAGTAAITITGAEAPDGGNYNVVIHQDGVLTIISRPASGGGGGGSSTPSAPVAEVKNGDSVPKSNLGQLIAENKPLTVAADNGAKLVFDTDALKGISSQALGDVKVEIRDVTPTYQEELPDKLVFSLTLSPAAAPSPTSAARSPSPCPTS